MDLEQRRFHDWFYSLSLRNQIVAMLSALIVIVLALVAAFGEDTPSAAPTASPPVASGPTNASATSPPATSPSVSSSSIEYKMAVVDGHSAPSASVIARYERAMSAAVRNCPNTKQQIADMSVRSTQLLADEGVEASALEMVEALNTSVSGVDAGDCTDVFAVLISLMVNG